MIIPGNELNLRTFGGGPVGPGYPLDDDGTLTTMFGMGWIPTTPTLYNIGSYTYVSPSSPDGNIATPSVARFFSGGSAQIDITGTRIGMELEITTQPVGAYDTIYLGAVFMNGNSVAGQTYFGVRNTTGSNPVYNTSNGLSEIRAATSNIRIAIIIDKANDAAYFADTEGHILGDFTGYGAATHVVFFVSVSDDGTAAAAETMSFELIPDASNMSALFPPNCYDYAGQLCPVNPSWVDPAPPVYPTITSAATDIAGDTITVTFDMNVTGSPQLGWTFYRDAITVAPYGFSQPSANTFQYQFNTGTFDSANVITLDYDSGTGSVVSDPAGDPLQTVTGFSVTNNVTPPQTPCGYPLTDADAGLTLSNGDMTISHTVVTGTNAYFAYPANWYDTPFQINVGGNEHVIEFSPDMFPRPLGGTTSYIAYYRMNRFSDGAVFGHVYLSSQAANYTVALNISGGSSSSLNLGDKLPQRIAIAFHANDAKVYVYADNELVLQSSYNTANTPIVLHYELVTNNVSGSDIGTPLQTTLYTYYDTIKSTSFDYTASPTDPCEGAIPTPSTMPLTDAGVTAGTLGFGSAPGSLSPDPEYQTTTHVTTGTETGGFAISIPDYVTDPSLYKTLSNLHAIGMEITTMPTPTPASGDVAVVGLCATQFTVPSISKSFFLGGLRNDAGVDGYIAYRGTTAIYDNTFALDVTQTVSDVTTTKYAMVFNTSTGKVDYYINGQRQVPSAQTIATGSTNMFFALAFADNTGTPTNLNPNPVGATYTARIVTRAQDLEDFGLPPSVRDTSNQYIFARATTWHPADKGTNIVLSNGNLTATNATTNWESVKSMFGKSTGSWYWETTIGASGGVDVIIGLGNASAATSNYVGADGNSWGYRSTDGNYYTSGGSVAYGATFTTGDKIGVAFNADTGDVTMYKNGVSQGVMVTLAAGTYFPMVAVYNSDAATNFGADVINYPITYPVDYYNNGFYGA